MEMFLLQTTVFLSGSLVALFAEAMAAKVIPRIDAALVPIIPAKTDGVAADWGDRLRPGRCFVHLQQRGRLGFGFPRFTAGSTAILVAGGARAGVA